LVFWKSTILHRNRVERDGIAIGKRMAFLEAGLQGESTVQRPGTGLKDH
jgi:hypothetical protein